MADDGKILASDFIDSGIKAELKAVTDEMQRLVKATSDLMGVIRQSTTDQKAYVTVQKETETLTKQIVAAETKMKVLDTDLAKEAERKRQAQQKASKEQKDNIAAETSAYKKLSVEYGKALQKARDLAAQYGVNSEQAKKATTTAKGLNDQLKAIDASMGNHQRNVGNYASALEGATLSMGEMKRALRELRNIPLAGKTPEEIAQVEKQIAMLTDEMGDYQARMRSSGDSTQVMIEGLQGVVAVAQGVTGALSAMGFNTEKLDKAMVQLIGVSQALATIHELNEKQTIKSVAAVIKDTYAKAANAVATKAQAMATTGATVATRALGTAMKSVPFVAIVAAVVAVAAAMVTLAVKMRQASAETRMMNKVNAEAAKSTADERANLVLLMKIAKDHTRSIDERKKAIEAINKISPEYLGNITLENIGTQESIDKINGYINAINRKARATAYSNMLTEKYTELAELETKSWDNLSGAQKTYWNILAGQTRLGLSGREQYELGYLGELNAIYEEIDAITKLAQKYVEVDDIVDDTNDSGRNSTKVIQDNATAEDELTESIKAANEQYSLRLSYLKNESDATKYQIELIGAQIEQTDAILAATQKYYLQDAEYSDDEKAVLTGLKNKSDELEKQKKLYENLIGVKKEAVTIADPFASYQKRPEGMLAPFAQGDPIETELTKLMKLWETYGQTVSSVYDGINTVISNSFDRQAQEIDAQQAKSDEYFENKLKACIEDEDVTRQVNAEKEAADKKLERERKAIAIRQAKFEKAQALLSVGLNTSKAIMNIIATTPVASWPFLIAGAAATGLAQTAAIMSKPIPAYASGIDSTPTTGAALVGERGSEAILYPDGSVAIADRPTVTILPRGTEVKNAFDTEDYLRKLSFAAMLPKIGKTDANEKDYTMMLKDIHRTLKRGNTVINQGMSAREQYYYKIYSV